LQQLILKQATGIAGKYIPKDEFWIDFGDPGNQILPAKNLQ